MKKNVAGQDIGVQMVNISDGLAFTGTARVAITIDAGVQDTTPGGTVTHEGRGLHTYDPTQAETNGDHLAFTFDDSGGLAVPVTVQVYTTDAITDQVWDEAQADHTTAGSFGEMATELASVLAGTVTNAQGADVASDVAAMIDVNNRVDVGSWLGTAVTLGAGAPDVNVASMDAASIASGVIAAAELTNIENEIWDALKSAHVVANSFGDFLDIEVSSRLAPTVAARTLDVAATGEAGLDFGNTVGVMTGGQLGVGVYAAGAITAAAIAASALDGKGDWNIGKTGYALSSTGGDAILKTSTFALAMADAIWDEILTAAEHNVPTSAGRRLRQIEAGFVITSGTAQAGGAASITLAAGESSTDEIFQGDRVVIIAGTGIGEHGIVIAYDGTTKICTMSQNWVITPDATSEYELQPADVDVETWQHAIVSVSATTSLPEVDAKSISDDATAADNLELFTENALGADNKILISTDAQDLSATLDVNTKTLTAAAIAAATFAADAITATALAASAVDEIRDGIMPTQNAAFNNLYFLFVSSGDHVTPVTGAGTMAVTRSIDGSAFASGTGTGPAEVGNGIYQYDASAADMNGGVIQFRFTAASGTPAAPDDAHVTVVTGGGV